LNPEVMGREIHSASTAGGKPAVEVNDVTFYWSGNDQTDANLLLRNVSFAVQPGQLCVVAGPTGSGKSGLLSGLIGDVFTTSPLQSIAIRGHVAYTAQVPWIQNMTLRDNILYGKPYDSSFYKKVLRACALEPDLEVLPNRDMTEIGEKGVNLSGGQKQRIALARAVYERADVYLLDDCLSAVDSEVARHIFKQVIQGLLLSEYKSSVVFVTHATWAFPAADTMVLVSKSKTLAGVGSLESLKAQGLDVMEFVSGDDDALDDDGGGEGRLSSGGKPSLSKRDSNQTMQRVSSLASQRSRVSSTASDKRRTHEGKLVETEVAEVGAVKLAVYLEYVNLGGGKTIVVLVFALICLTSVVSTGSSYWLSVWTDPDVITDQISSDLGIGIYAILGIAFAVMTVASVYSAFILFAFHAARNAHEQLVAAVIRAPMMWFDVTPLGRLLNRFAEDVYSLDQRVIDALYNWMQMGLVVITTIALVAFASPFFLIACIPLGYIYYYTQNYFIASSRQIKRLDSISKSPLYAHFSETLNGVTSVRAFQSQSRFVHENVEKLRANLQAWY
jgi:ABC-type multidrug transport system fused ATPase/permease subunit